MINRLMNLPRTVKRGMFWLVDLTLVPISLYLAFALHNDALSPFAQPAKIWPLFALTSFFSGFVFYALQLPWIKLHAFEARAVSRVALAAMALAGAAILTSYLFDLPASIPALISFGAIFFTLATTVRICGLYALSSMLERANSSPPALIYGAGNAGGQLASALRESRAARPVAFIDDNVGLQGLVVGGLQVYSAHRLQRLVKKHHIQRIYVAMPSADKARRNRIIARLSELMIEIQVLPTYATLIADGRLIEDLRPVTPAELLGREKVDLNTPAIAKTYAGRVVMVTGAGGSIGSELCRQLLGCHPERIIMLEQSEFQLYIADQELKPQAEAAGVQIKSLLGSVTDKARITQLIRDEQVEIILHTAAYKHVPLVEENELEGARNNVLGTQVVAEAAHAAKIERFILISTDKAVRPANVMGATKRMAELVVQDIRSRSQHTKFGIVRFGNVLGSSGSVLPLFQKQISRGGPVTVTHPDVTRFFMTITEATRLVLLVGAYAGDDDVFVLDMGKPRKIMDVARQMIALSGQQIYNPQTGNGGVKIEITGLRPGEKLHEELLIDESSLHPTPHPKILKAKEAYLSQIEIARMLKELKACIDANNPDLLRQLMRDSIEGYHSDQETSQEG